MIMSVVLAAFALVACDSGDDETKALPMLSTDRRDIVDADGNVVALRGTNLGGWLVQESWMCPTLQADTLSTNMTLYSRFGKEDAEALIAAYQDKWITETDFRNIKELGLNVVRIPFTYMNIYYYLSDEGELLSPDEFVLREDAFARLDWAIGMCEKYGLYAILDLHGAVGSQNGNDHSGDTSGSNLYQDDATGEAYRAKTAELWGLVAEHFAGNSCVAGYDLLNEPGNASEETQWDYYDVLYETVREKDAEHIIFIEAVWEPYNLPLPSVYGWENVVYEYHHYNWDYANQSNASFYYMKKLLGSGFNVPSFIGEFNAWGDSRRTVGKSEQTDEEALAGVLELYNGEGWHWTTWTYKVVVTGMEQNSTWGLYNGNFGLDDSGKANPATDSYEKIMEIWSTCSTDERFSLYEDIADIVSGAAAAEFCKGAPSGEYSIL